MYGSGLGLCFLAYFRLRNCRPQLASRKCLPPRLKEKKLGFFSIYLGLFPFGSVFNQVSISRLYISPTVRCTDSRWKLELNTLPKVKSLDKFKKTPLFFSQALEKHCTSCLERGKYNCLPPEGQPLIQSFPSPHFRDSISSLRLTSPGLRVRFRVRF